MNIESYWYIVFVILIAVYLFIQFSVKNRKRYFMYFISGAVFGFMFDAISLSQKYYVYYPYPPVILGAPLSVTIGEGCAVAITMYLIAFIKKCYTTKSITIKNLP